MVKKQTRRQRDIKSKLLAAICMLLVSSIMMVSSTYAWFTLSTAPEVKGITTAVGANGNLEMALQPMDGNSTKETITSNVGDGAKSVAQKNLTWGNLVDVSDTAQYGLNSIMLYPSKLNTTTVTYGDGTTTGLASSPLATPEYGADGRITTLATKTFTGVYDGTGFSNSISTSVNNVTTTVNNPYGVRAVGTSSGMSDRQLAYRAALQAASTAASQAKRVASQSLNNNGAALADIAIKHATATTAETYSVTELQSLQTIVNELLGYDTTTSTGGSAVTTHTTGSLEYIEEALIQYALATALANVASDDRYQTYVTAFEGATLDTLASVMTANQVTNASVTDYIDKLQTSYSNVRTAKSSLDTLLNNPATDATFEWSQFNTALYKLADPDQMQVNGIAVSDLNKDWNVGTEYAGGKYTSGDTTYDVDADGFVLDPEADEAGNHPRISNMSRLVDAVLGEGIKLIIGSGAGVYADIADFCGDYSASVTLSKITYGGLSIKNLDAQMSTKTSQTTPYLTQANNAVPAYSAGASTSATSNITDFYGFMIDLAFRTNVADSYLQLQTKAVDRIYSDSTNEATMGGGASMTFTATNNSFSGVAVKSLMQCIRVVFFDTDSRAILGYAGLDVSSAETGSTGSITMDLIMTDENGNALSSANIMALEQNTVHELSVLVYLDGEKITNADVANAASSMTGSMNLQFSSSAVLTPMDYSDLKNGTGATTPTVTTTTLTNVSVTGDSTVSVAKAVYDGTNIAIQLSGYTNQTVTIQVGDGTATAVTPTTMDGVTGFTYAAADVAANTAIVINVTAVHGS